MSVLEFLRQQLNNQIFSGGLVLGALAGLAAYWRGVPGHLWRWLRSRLITTVDISDHDQAFYWLQIWLGQHEYTKSRARRLTLTTRTAPVGQDAPKSVSQTRRQPQIDVIFSPAPGYHLFRYKGLPILLERIRTESKTTTASTSYHETFVLHCFSRAIVESLIRDAREVATPTDDNRVAIHKPGWQGWRLTQLRKPRSLDSVILDDGTSEDLLADLQWFMSAQDWYAEHGIPYQRGYLLAGPPGNGKTSIILALASILRRDIYIMNLSTMSDAELSHQLTDIPEHSFLLLEDIDGAFVGREKVNDANDRLSFSGLLNAIDGVSAPTGRLLFMTTNHLEKIDPALKRPGRADRTITLVNATPSMARRLFLQFFPSKPGLAEEFFEAFKSNHEQRSMASLQELLIKHLRDPRGAILELGAKPNNETGQDPPHLRVQGLD